MLQHMRFELEKFNVQPWLWQGLAEQQQACSSHAAAPMRSSANSAIEPSGVATDCSSSTYLKQLHLKSCLQSFRFGFVLGFVNKIVTSSLVLDVA